jgi:hypothetical protein
MDDYIILFAERASIVDRAVQPSAVGRNLDVERRRKRPALMPCEGAHARQAAADAPCANDVVVLVRGGEPPDAHADQRPVHHRDLDHPTLVAELSQLAIGGETSQCLDVAEQFAHAPWWLRAALGIAGRG